MPRVLSSGGLTYSAGAIVYAIKRPNPFPRVFGFHEIWHLFVVAGSALHFGFHALSALALGVGFVGAGGLVTACVKLLQATHLSMLNMSEEAALIRAREQTSSPPV